MNVSWKPLACLLGLVIASAPQGEAATINWIGPNSYWDIGANWSLGRAPRSSDDVSVGNGRNSFLQSNGVAQDLSASFGNVYTADNSLNVGSASGGRVRIGGLGADGFSGNVVVGAGGSLLTSGVSVLNFGRLAMTGGEAIILNGDLTTQTHSEFNGGQVRGYGTVSAWGSRVVNNGWIIAEGGTLTVDAFGDGGMLDLDGASGEGLLYAVTGDLTLRGDVTDAFDGLVNLGGGHAITVDDDWQMRGEIHFDSSGVLQGGRIAIGDDLAPGIATVTVRSGNGAINAPATFGSNVSVFVPTGSTLTINNAGTVFRPQNGATNGRFYGTGDLRVVGAEFAEPTTFDMTGGTVGLDGWLSGAIALTPGDTDLNANLTINARTMDDFGTGLGSIGGLSPSVSDLNIASGARLTVNLDNAADSWRVNGMGVVNYNGVAGSPRTFLAGSPVRMDGTLNVRGAGASSALLSIGSDGLVSIASASRLTLDAGSDANPNQVLGGRVAGAGVLELGAGRTFQGYGQIDTPVVGVGLGSEIASSGGVLRLDGAIDNVGTLRFRGGSTLRLGQPLDTNDLTRHVRGGGGTLEGAPITVNSAPLQGHGTVYNLLTNNGEITSGDGWLILDNPDSDYDGDANNGSLVAHTQMVIRDNARFPFRGSLTIGGGAAPEVHVEGFELEFEPGSILNLGDGASYTASEATDFGGAVSVSPGVATLYVPTARFEDSSRWAIDGTLLLGNKRTVVDSGAEFHGTGELVNASLISNATLDLADGALIGLSVTNERRLRIAGAAIGVAAVGEFSQTSDGTFYVNVSSTDADHLQLNGAAALDGSLRIESSSAIAPDLYDAFTLLTAGAGVTGRFSTEDFSAAPTLRDGLKWEVLYNSNSVDLMVELVLPGDFNNDGVVDQADYTVYRDHLGTSALLPGDPTPGAVTTDDRDVWAANYGSTAVGSSASLAIPEPATLLLALASAVSGVSGRRVRRDPPSHC